MLVGDTGIEPVTSSVSGKRSPAELIALTVLAERVVPRGGNGIRTRVHGFAGRCLASRPSHQEGPQVRNLSLFRADDGIRTRDPHLGKVMRYQLRYVRLSSPPDRAAMAGPLYPNPDVPSKPVRRLLLPVLTGTAGLGPCGSRPTPRSRPD